jgi:CubicO group peptidase (beta-lactamase class C family)
MQAQELYFPPLLGSQWETTSPQDLEWCLEYQTPLNDFLVENNTKAFIILKDGKIAVEEYFDGFGKDSLWYWASAGKSLSSMLVGIAQEKGLLNIEDKTSDYLGEGWTSMDVEKENNITIRHQLSMTTGIKEDNDENCLDPDCLVYEAEPGTLWKYNNAPYRLVQDVIANASGLTFQQFTNQNLSFKTGILGLWIDYVFYSTPRNMARFGLLSLNKGIWDDTPVLSDTEYFNTATNSSQDLNPSYGYLWWLNGKESFNLPGLDFNFNGSIIPNGPSDMICALGKNDQKIYIVPSKNIVIVRMGNASGEIVGAVSSFDNQLWEFLNNLICETSSSSDLTNEAKELLINQNSIANSGVGNVIVNLMTIKGELIFQKNLKQQESIDITNIPTGIYFINYTNNLNNVKNRKFIKY